MWARRGEGCDTTVSMGSAANLAREVMVGFLEGMLVQMEEMSGVIFGDADGISIDPSFPLREILEFLWILVLFESVTSFLLSLFLPLLSSISLIVKLSVGPFSLCFCQYSGCMAPTILGL